MLQTGSGVQSLFGNPFSSNGFNTQNPPRSNILSNHTFNNQFNAAFGIPLNEKEKKLQDFRQNYHSKLDGFTDDLKCFICLSFVCVPLQFQCCSKLICKECFLKLQGKAQFMCPSCNNQSRTVNPPDSLILEIIDQFRVSCLDCKTTFNYGDSDSHFRTQCLSLQNNKVKSNQSDKKKDINEKLSKISQEERKKNEDFSKQKMDQLSIAAMLNSELSTQIFQNNQIKSDIKYLSKCKHSCKRAQHNIISNKTYLKKLIINDTQIACYQINSYECSRCKLKQVTDNLDFEVTCPILDHVFQAQTLQNNSISLKDQELLCLTCSNNVKVSDKYFSCSERSKDCLIICVNCADNSKLVFKTLQDMYFSSIDKLQPIEKNQRHPHSLHHDISFTKLECNSKVCIFQQEQPRYDYWYCKQCDFKLCYNCTRY
ncbi:UNKNOWN [Stylonychia lemnae]|uniref:RING-type domain-containing protein n=1 Tax=Stylonychia lemnae TaxID=5949 RepID=A0A078AF12_STYLE|nr:UNKNOWN [Stylonychia lemnae]|eukprot:CDW80112.1 UNKNOWN [Stylonychia lemnae]